MAEHPAAENKMGVMPVNTLLLNMAIPIMISMLVQAFYNVVDSYFVSQLNEDALNAVSLAFPVQNLMIAVSVGTGVGINALLSRSLGEKNQDNANRAAVNGIFLAALSCLAFVALGLTCSRWFYTVQTDIPGIIEGASEGKGLGLRFLRHIERNAVLLFMVPADSDDISKDYEVLLRELREFNPELVDKNRVLAVSKSDMLDDELRDEIAATLPDDIPVVFISAVTGQGIPELKDILWREINSEDNKARFSITHRPLDVRHRVEEEDNFIFGQEDDDDEEDLSDYTDQDWEDEFWDEESSVND